MSTATQIRWGKTAILDAIQTAYSAKYWPSKWTGRHIVCPNHDVGRDELARRQLWQRLKTQDFVQARCAYGSFFQRPPMPCNNKFESNA
jgi:hypothetical protein